MSLIIMFFKFSVDTSQGLTDKKRSSFRVSITDPSGVRIFRGKKTASD